MQVLIPTSQFIRSLIAGRLATDVLDVPTVLIARTDAHSAQLLTMDIDPVDKPFIHGERTPEGFFRYQGGIKVFHLCPSLQVPMVVLRGMKIAMTLNWIVRESELI